MLALDVVNPAGIDVSLDDIGGLEGIKSTLVSCAASLSACMHLHLVTDVLRSKPVCLQCMCIS